MGKRVARGAVEALAETLWPTRCAVCDVPGAVLCGRCRDKLNFVDWWRACRRCGAPFGFVQCDACTCERMNTLGIERFPFSGCVSAVMYSAEAGRLVRVFKDQGEQRLSGVMAQAIAQVVPPGWDPDLVTYVPATAAAVRVRGFDHTELLAEALACFMRIPCTRVLARPKPRRDQRGLGVRERADNLRGAFGSSCCSAVSGRLLLVDDVFTTGATLCAASEALLAAGAGDVACATFARV